MIRPARPGDVPAVEELVAAAYQPWADLIGIRPKPMDDDYAAHVAAGHVHLLEEDEPGEGIAGLIVLVPEDGVLLVDNVAVAPGRHGRGLGRRLLAFAEDRARTAGLGALRLYTNARMEPNIALYLRLGYEITERRRSGPRDVVFMAKRLDG
ncbi:MULTISPECIES: GNAT family N-acetyltransferase [Streptosporangium]|uniref:GNAT superfamily N-acetyltransferase n=1 Tax=Streptosporangium brasiliense TaxID=47480 RepID=A0ABT9R0U3_9ACTN|nr:GNAT family N-acetyltransferase [Streptosporangium brasiliense]MDP9862845.1 GNAT superfamily N-acetyltransferase [Streptosporangium brasiliense]